MATQTRQKYKNRQNTPAKQGRVSNYSGLPQKSEINVTPDNLFIFTVFLMLSFGLWQAISLKLGFMAQSDVNVIKILVQSAFCALCFVPIAVYWEKVRHLSVALFPILIAFLMITSSAVWSGEHANSTRDSVVLFLMFCAALGAVSHLKGYKTIALMTIALVTSLMLQFISQVVSGDLGNLQFKDSELALCLSMSLMAFTYNKSSKILWLMIAALVLLVGVIINDKQVYIVAIIAMIVAIMHRLNLGVKDRNFYLASQFVNILALFTVVVLFYGTARLGQVWYLLSQMDSNSIIGTGFIGEGQSIMLSFVNGLGLMGLMLGLLFLFYIIGGLLVKNNTGLGIRIFEYSLIAIILGNSGGISTFSLSMMALFIAICLNILPSPQNKTI